MLKLSSIKYDIIKHEILSVILHRNLFYDILTHFFFSTKLEHARNNSNDSN